MKKNSLLILIFVVLLGFSSMAQGGGIWNFNWNIGFPMGDTKDFIEKPSFRGFSIDGSGFVTDKITIGGLAAWNVFYEDLGFVTLKNEETSLYGYKRRYLNIMPLMVKGQFFFAQNGVQPYIGLGLGTYYIESRDFMGLYYIQGKDWHFGFAPEVGVVLPFSSSNTGINVNFKYNMAAKTKDQQAYSWLGINIGISYLF